MIEEIIIVQDKIASFHKQINDDFSEPWRQSSGKALIPFVVFVLFYFGFALITRDFYKVPMTVAFLVSSAAALCLNRKEKLSRKIELFAFGMGHRDIMIMCLVFVLAGAFTATAKAVGGVEAAMAVARAFVPSQFMLSGLFVVSGCISLAMGTSCGTIAAMIPIAVSLSQNLGLDAHFAAGAVVGGSMFGDNLSLISDTTIAATRTQGVEMRDKMLCNLRIVALPAFACVCLYALPMFSTPAAVVAETSALTVERWIKVLPYIFLFTLGLCGQNVMGLLFLGTILNLLIGCVYGNFSLLDAFSIIGDGTTEMAPTIIISLLAGGMLALVRYNGGIEFVIRATGRWIKSRRTCELGICFLTGLMNLFTANNTIAIITSGQLAKELGHRYGVNPKRIASLLDTPSCIVQGILPYGAQILIATGLSTAVQLSAFDIVRGSFYPYLMAAGVMWKIMGKFK
ncbi:MAG: Na+/H+ antiporter NhaC family protein [Opitutales bacterium]|nr:Na+/H+ antiporter NhaC family protein [Opitutales bacterium]